MQGGLDWAGPIGVFQEVAVRSGGGLEPTEGSMGLAMHGVSLAGLAGDAVCGWAFSQADQSANM